MHYLFIEVLVLYDVPFILNPGNQPALEMYQNILQVIRGGYEHIMVEAINEIQDI